MGIREKKGFTFIEIVVVIAVISLALPTLYSIFYTMVQQQSKIIRLNLVKRESTYIANMLTKVVRDNATGIYSSNDINTAVCAFNSGIKTYTPSSPNLLWFKDKYDNWFNFILNANTLASQSSIPVYPTSTNLNSNRVLISNFTYQCSVTAYSAPLVIFSYDICFNSSGSCGTGNDAISFHFTPTVKLRNY